MTSDYVTHHIEKMFEIKAVEIQVILECGIAPLDH
jgi:hypothetical protein